MTTEIVQCAQHGSTPDAGCRNCATARLVNDAAERDHLEARIETMKLRLSRVLRFACSRRPRHWDHNRPHGVWSRGWTP